MNNQGKHHVNPIRIPRVPRTALLLLAAVLLFNGYTMAKFFIERERKVPVVAKNFYFESDLLASPTGAVPQYTLQAGEDTISFSLMNYPDKLRASEVDISYTVSVTKDGAEVASKTDVISAGRNKVSVSFDSLAAGSYLVTASATSPYSQTLQGKFTVVSTDYGLYYDVSDVASSPNLKVTVTTTDYSGNIVISWPNGVLPDNTDPLLEGVGGNSCTMAVKAQSEYTFLFFKTQPSSDYSNSITISKGNS